MVSGYYNKSHYNEIHFLGKNIKITIIKKGEKV